MNNSITVPFGRLEAAYLGGFFLYRRIVMHMVEVSQDGVELGTIRFRGISNLPTGEAPKRRYKCTPKDCVPKLIARKIADRLAFGITAGHEEAYAWREQA
ncbi:MAG TPA: hypothetical protein VGI75_15860 [Pirellulales bacterium]|jgi:hypothetical protein